MENIITYGKVAITVIGAVVGGLIGEINGMMIALLVFMAIDYITGVIIAIDGKALSSEVGFKGLLRKATILLVVIVANVVDAYVIGAGAAVRSAAIAFYLANEGISILENTTLLGVPYPDKLRDILIQLKMKNDDK